MVRLFWRDSIRHARRGKSRASPYHCAEPARPLDLAIPARSADYSVYARFLEIDGFPRAIDRCLERIRQPSGRVCALYQRAQYLQHR